MWASTQWQDYELIDTADGNRLERWGDFRFVRPDPQVIWKTPQDAMWDDVHARYNRSSSGGGSWEVRRKIPQSWQVSYGPLRFRIRPTNFKHMGLFPEQAANWDFIMDQIARAVKERGEVRLLNLFGYTGAASLAAARAGAQVCHVDASKGIVSWAKDNAVLSGLGEAPIRYIVDDCVKFVQREKRRGHTYDAIIMDPPSYGRGAGGQVWKLEDDLYDFVKACGEILSDEPLFVIINSYTTGLSAAVMSYLLELLVTAKYGGRVESDDLGLQVSRTGLYLPCGAASRWMRDEK